MRAPDSRERAADSATEPTRFVPSANRSLVVGAATLAIPIRLCSRTARSSEWRQSKYPTPPPELRPSWRRTSSHGRRSSTVVLISRDLRLSQERVDVGFRRESASSVELHPTSPRPVRMPEEAGRDTRLTATPELAPPAPCERTHLGSRTACRRLRPTSCWGPSLAHPHLGTWQSNAQL